MTVIASSSRSQQQTRRVTSPRSAQPDGRRPTPVKRPNLRFEKELLRGGTVRLAAMDEVGRGALAGPVTVGVVVITPSIGRVPPGLADSKLLTPAARELLVKPIRRWVTEYAVGHASPAEIDEIGIIAALRTAGRRALAALSGPVDVVLLDGNHNYLTTPTVPALQSDDLPLFEIDTPPAAPSEPRVHVRIKADMTCAAVAGASVLAKTERDRLLVEMSPRFPRYGFAVNKGYGTPEHVTALREHGPCAVHRRSWRLPGEEPDLFCESAEALLGPGG
jgi:ribonuclease HII